MFISASKTGPSFKQMKLKEWVREISSLGICESREKQIEERLRDGFTLNSYAHDEHIFNKLVPSYIFPLLEEEVYRD